MFGLGKNNAKIDAFADELVSEFGKRFPAERETQLGTKKAKPARNLGKAAAELVDRRFTNFIHNEKLGVYGKARLLNRIKWQMTEASYSDEFIGVTIAELTRASTRKKSAEGT